MPNDLFGDRPKRRPARIMMHAIDAGQSISGHSAAHFKCEKCGHDAGWIEIPPTATAIRRGWACPQCNEAHT